MLLKDALSKDKKDIALIHSLLEQLKAQSPVLPTASQEEADEVQLRLQETRKDPPAPEHPRVW